MHKVPSFQAETLLMVRYPPNTHSLQLEMIARTCVACFVQGPTYGIAFANENTRKIEVNTAFLQRT